MSYFSNRKTIHQNIFLGLLVLMVIGMQFSHFLVSISIMLISANYLVEGNYITKLRVIWQHKTITLFFGLFVLHVLGILWSTDIDYAIHDIQIKLPILALPIVIGSSSKISRKQFNWVLLFFLATSLLSSLIGSIIYFVLSQPGDDYRLMSPFMSHIRLSLIMGVAILSAFYLGFKSKDWEKFKPWFIGLGIWLIIFLFMLRAMSGILAVLPAGFILIWSIFSKLKSKITLLIKMLLIGSSLSMVIYIVWQVNEFYTFQNLDLSKVATHSKGGEKYYFNTSSQLVENGNFVHSFIATNELKNEWSKNSKLDFEGADHRGQPLKSTLIRYLTSKNLKKDREGVQSMTHLDIWAVENGIANEKFLNEKSINTLVYRYIWEIHNYTIPSHNPQGNSLGQRFLFWKIGSQIFKDNWITGVGTGNVQFSYNKQYEKLPFNVSKKYRLRAHNQYLTMGITFGLFGLIYFIITLFSGFWVKPNSRSYLFLGAFIILAISMLDEDTLETQFGVTYAMFFYFLFLFQEPSEKELDLY